MFFSLGLLAIGAGVATFIENDFGTSASRVLVYNNIWYEIVFFLALVNLLGLIYKFKMWKNIGKFLFHSSFVFVLIGAFITRYYGFEGMMPIPEKQTTNIIYSSTPYLQVSIVDKNNDKVYKEYNHEFNSLITSLNHFSHDIQFKDKTFTINYHDYSFQKKGKATMGLLTLLVDGPENVSKKIKLPAMLHQEPMQRQLDFGDYIVSLSYGSKLLKIPFSIHLEDFELLKYPGSNSPSSFSSFIEVVDKDNNKDKFKIFMNNPFSIGNYLFFQSSYFPDETGTVLSVNNDPGKYPTYLGYFLFILGILIYLFSRNSRIVKLYKYINNKNILPILIGSIFIFNQPIFAQEIEKEKKLTPIEMKEYLEEFKVKSLKSAELFSKLTIQTFDGKMKTLDSLNKDITFSLLGKNSIFGLNHNQIILSMISRPEIWGEIKLFKVKSPQVIKELGLKKETKKIAFIEFYNKNRKAILEDEVNKAFSLSPAKRGTYEKELIKLTDKVNYLYQIFQSNFLRIYPKGVKDKSIDNNKWYSPLEALDNFKNQNLLAIDYYTKGLFGNLIKNNWEEVNKFITKIDKYQGIVSPKLKLSEEKLKNELFFNKLNIFFNLTFYFLILSLIGFIISFFFVFKENLSFKKTQVSFFILVLIGFLLFTAGMGGRWYLSGYAPWSNLYESLLFISWAALFSALVFFRKSVITLVSALIVSSIFMFVAHLTEVNPQITTLTPVLQSYWLTIHVSTLTISYGFFGVVFFLGLFNLLLFCFRENKPYLNDRIRVISSIMEILLIIGLLCISIGNYLGAIWANESWGRYWGWDPKETWAYVSIIVYILVTHLRFMIKKNYLYWFNISSVLAFSSIIMTYVGVNFYLSGLHSYATGDPIIIPTWVYFFLTLIFILFTLSFRKRDLIKEI